MRPDPTPSSDAATPPVACATALVADHADDASRRRASAARSATLVDHGAASTAVASFETLGDVALVALGSYARRELCPGSDVDVMLLHDRPPPARGGLARRAEDALVPALGRRASSRVTRPARVKEAVALADSELDALTATARGAVRSPATRRSLRRPRWTGRAGSRRTAIAARRRRSSRAAAAARAEHPGPIAEMLEPNLKDGAGGLRDLQAPAGRAGHSGESGAPGATPGAGGWSIGVATLVALGYLRDDDRRASAGGA